MNERYEHAMAILANDNGAGWFSAYNDLVWALVTSSPEELEFFWDRYCGIDDKGTPVPVIVLAFKLLGVASKSDPEMQDRCRNQIALYCDPIEEKNAQMGME